MKKWLLINLLVVLFLGSLVGCRFFRCSEQDKALNTNEIYNFEFWNKRAKHSEKLIMNQDEIKKFNNDLINDENVNIIDLNKFDKVLSKSQLNTILSDYIENSMPVGTRYIKDVKLDEEYYNKIIKNINLDGINDENVVQYGVVVNNTHIRTFPTDDVSYYAPNDFFIDLNYETGLKVCERALVLHTSADKKYYFVKTEFYDGWVAVEDIALTDRSTWVEYDSLDDFLVVTGDYINLNYNLCNATTSEIKLVMGTKLPLITQKPNAVDKVSTEASYVVNLPTRDCNGRLEFVKARVPFNKDVSVGYLTYNQKNVLQQVFKLVGNIYGWSDLWGSRDCSSSVRDVYKSFGFNLPRNTGKQTKICTSVDVSKMDLKEKKDFIKSQPVGSMVYMPGHVMMYIGSEDKEPYVIHATYKAKIKNSEEEKNEFYNSTVISKLSDLHKYSGESFLGLINVVLVIK